MLVLATISFYGQEVEGVAESSETSFNRWSLEFNVGVHKPITPFTPNRFTSPVSLWNVDLGARYMFTNEFGAKLDFGYYSIENAEDGSLPFETKYWRTSLQGVVNAGSILGLRDFSDRINFLVHGGLGYSQLLAKEPMDRDTDQIVNLIAGITPQIKLSNSVALTGDVSAIANIRQNYTWDGIAAAQKRGVQGLMFTGSIGLTIYLGNEEVHADWYEENLDEEVLDSLGNRIAKIEKDLLDTDQDGVPDYLDREPSTMSGVAVDSKGYAVDTNQNGIPDELEGSLEEMYAKKGEAGAGSSHDVIKKLINDGYVNVYFQFNSDKPATYSLESINYLVKYLTENPSANGEIIGYADEIGEPAYNEALSERRAQRVMDILVAAGIDAGRLTITGNGEDASVDKSSSEARQLVRRVTFKLN